MEIPHSSQAYRFIFVRFFISKFSSEELDIPASAAQI